MNTNTLGGIVNHKKRVCSRNSWRRTRRLTQSVHLTAVELEKKNQQNSGFDNPNHTNVRCPVQARKLYASRYWWVVTVITHRFVRSDERVGWLSHIADVRLNTALMYSMVRVYVCARRSRTHACVCMSIPVFMWCTHFVRTLNSRLNIQLSSYDTKQQQQRRRQQTKHTRTNVTLYDHQNTRKLFVWYFYSRDRSEWQQCEAAFRCALCPSIWSYK